LVQKTEFFEKEEKEKKNRKRFIISSNERGRLV